MKYPLVGKSAVLGLLLSACGLTAAAQKIDEKELKVEIQKISASTQQLFSLEPVTFKYDVKKYKYLNLPAGNQYGFLASNVQLSFPDLVHETSKQIPSGKNSNKVASYNEVDNKDLIPVLVAAVKEQQLEIENLKKEISILKQKAK
jgi:CRISPR/Cas system-associated protein Cas5 (RAMP superfamily)